MQFTEDNLRAILVAAIQVAGDRPATTVKAVMAALAGDGAARSQADPFAFQVPDLNPGEEYAGLISPPDGIAPYHLILLPGDQDDAPWQTQMDWAKRVGGDLPDRVEQAMLFKYLPNLFQKAAYWSNTPHSDSAYAWCQDFTDGLQYFYRKDDSLRARAVRRLFI